MKDLHIHTIYSDGEYNENEILEKIINAKITEFAICDHDTIEGSEKVYNILKEKNLNLKFHSGLELSCRANNYLDGINIHLLVRDFKYDDYTIKKLLEKTSSFRLMKTEAMCKRIEEKFNIVFSKEEINTLLKTTNSIGKPHMYTLLKKHINIDREEYYKNMKNLPTENLKLEATEVLQLINKTQGYVTLAHPIEIMQDYNLNYQDIDCFVKYLKDYGLEAIETKHSKHTFDDYAEFSKIAKKYNLKETEGSDYHGPNVKPNIHLGICKKNSD